MDGKDACAVTYFGDGGTSEVNLIMIDEIRNFLFVSLLLMEVLIYLSGILIVLDFFPRLGTSI